MSDGNFIHHGGYPPSSISRKKKNRYKDRNEYNRGERDLDYQRDSYVRYDRRIYHKDRDRDHHHHEDYEKREGRDMSLSQSSNVKAPVILAKPTALASKSKESAAAVPESSSASTPETETSDTKWQEVSSSPSVPIAPKLSMTFSRSPQPASEKKLVSTAVRSSTSESKFNNRNSSSHSYLKQGSQNSHEGSNSSARGSNKDLATKPVVKLLDSSLHWVDNGISLMHDQTDFMVVGVIGMQGAGKSTVLSILASNRVLDDPGKTSLFRPQSTEVKQQGGHQTSGIDLAITHERLILLDAQPILSASVLEQSIHERKGGNGGGGTPDFNGTTTVETQSLQVTAFLLTVCHIVLVVQDWFTDGAIYNFLQTAEMLKPVQPAPAHDNPTTVEREPSELQPIIVFVHNKLDASNFNIRSIASMNEISHSLTKFSGLHCHNRFSLVDSNLYPGLQNLIPGEQEVNTFLIPDFNDDSGEEEKCDTTKVSYDPADHHFLSLPQYTGRPSSALLKHTFRKMVLSTPRHHLTHQVLTEKNWFHYAARTWEAIRKSQLVSEYNRLLTG